MDQVSTGKGLSLFSHRIHNLEETMGQLERPLQLTTLSAARVVRCFCLALHMTPPPSPETANGDVKVTSSVRGALQAYVKASHWSIELWFLFPVSVFPALKLSFL